MDEHHNRATRTQAAAAQALGRLVHLAETRNSGQIQRIALFIAALYDSRSFPLDLRELRTVDVAISDDMLICIDAVRWGISDLHNLLPNGARRMEEIIKAWGVAPPDPPVPADGAELAARLITAGDAPGYRDVTLHFSCKPMPRSDSSERSMHLNLHIDAKSAEAIADHILGVHRFAWSRNELPLDVRPGEQPPRWFIK